MSGGQLLFPWVFWAGSRGARPGVVVVLGAGVRPGGLHECACGCVSVYFYVNFSH